MRKAIVHGSRILLVVCFLFGIRVAARDMANSPERPSVHFQLRSGFLVVVKGQIGGLEGLKFIVDTGASYTFIDRKVADKLKLARRPGKTTNFDRDVPVEWAVVPDLRVGPLQTGAFRVMVANLREYSELAEDVDGILGLDVLGKCKKLFIDYEKRTVSWEFAGEGESRRSTPAYFTIPIVVQGFPMHLVIDTGFEVILMYKDRLQRGLPHLRTEGEATEGGVGRLQTTRVKLPGVRLYGPETVATVFLADAPESAMLPDIDGYLGVASLKAKRIEFDFAGRAMRWE